MLKLVQNYSDAKAEVGKRLNSVRQGLRETQAEFGERLGLKRRAIASFEEGRSAPDVGQLLILDRQNLDASFIAFGCHSLHSSTRRHEFALILKWVMRKCVAMEFNLGVEDQVDIAWSVYERLTRRQMNMVSSELESEIQHSLETAKVTYRI